MRVTMAARRKRVRKQPNLLLILTDQHNARCMSCAGEPLLRTPSMDRIAHEGVRFTNAFANSAHCGPSRISFLTGMYEHTHRRHRNVDEPPDGLNPIPSVLGGHGYQTALIGKGHLGIRWPRREFDYCRFSTMTDAFESDPLSCDYFRSLVEAGVADGYDMSQAHTEHPDCAHTSPLPLEHSPEVWCGNEVVKYLRQRDRARPFFAFVSFERPHNPLSVPAPFDTMYLPEDVVLPENSADTFEGKSTRQQTFVRDRHPYPFRPRDEAHLKTCLAHYYGLLSLIDQQIGRMLEELERQGELDNTIVVYSADHGDFAAEHGLMFKNLGFYECIHRIPLLVRFPKALPQGTTFEGFVESVDLYPTLAQLVGVEEPATVQGRSLVPALARGASWTKRASLCEHVKKYHHMSMRTPEFRITVDATGDGYHAEREHELYDHRSDPGELRNLWRDEAYRDIREELLLQMLSYRACPALLYGEPRPAGGFPREWRADGEPGWPMPEWCEEIRRIRAGEPRSEVAHDRDAEPRSRSEL